MSALHLVLGSALGLWLFWGLYILVMGIYRAHLSRRLSRVGYVLGLPWILLGYLVDVLANLTVASIVFVELPREWLVTDRLQRHVIGSFGWRERLASWICNHLLDIFDPTGNHC